MVLLEDIIDPYDDDRKRINITTTELRGLSEIKNDLDEIILLVLPEVEMEAYFEDSTILGQAQELISTYIVPFTTSQERVDHLKTNVFSNHVKKSFKFGYAFSISVCSGFSILNPMEMQQVNETINHPDTQKILFYFDEDKETVTLGANRMFQQRIVIFEKCKKFIAETRLVQHQKEYEIGFVMLHYDTNGTFYDDPRALQNFVKYWEMLSEWALNTKNMVILGDAKDGKREILEIPQQFSQVGWWRHRENKWMDKITEALREIQAYQEQHGLTTTKTPTTITPPTTTTKTTTPAIRASGSRSFFSSLLIFMHIFLFVINLS